MKRLMHMAEWPWTDHELGLSRFGLFLRSGEFLTTIFLVLSAYALVVPGSAFAKSPAFLWIVGTSNADVGVWAILAVALSITGPLALLLDRGTLRVLSLISQGIYFLIFGYSFRVYSPTGLVWLLFLTCGSWLAFRAGALIRHHWLRGGVNGYRRAG